MAALPDEQKAQERAELAKQLPILTGKVNAVIAKKERFSEKELLERSVQFGPVSFTYKDVLSFAEIFHLVDTDGSGQISALEVKHLMSLLGENVQLAEVEALIQEFDIDNSGEVDLTEFIYVLALQRKTDYKKAAEDCSERMALACSAFDMFGKATQSRRGVINKDVLRQALLQYGSSAATAKEIHKLVESLPSSEGMNSNEFDYLKHVTNFMS